MAAILWLFAMAILVGAMVPPQWPGLGKWGHSAWTGAAWLALTAGVFWLLWRR